MPNSDGKTNVRTLEQISAGGVVMRHSHGGSELAIIKMLPELRWQLPKGLIDEGESEEIAALREVREETGLNAELIQKIDTVEYWYFANRGGERVRYHKFVHFYLMRYVSGDVADHDHEVEEARWVTVEEALAKLAFKSERDMVTKAASLFGT